MHEAKKLIGSFVDGFISQTTEPATVKVQTTCLHFKLGMYLYYHRFLKILMEFYYFGFYLAE